MTKPIRVLSLGAGVQSTAVLLMMIHGEIPKADHVIFSDTGWEPAAVYKHLAKLEIVMAENDMPFHKVSAGNIRQDFMESETRFATMPLYTLNREGQKSMLQRQCTNEYKIQPLLKVQRQLAGLKKVNALKNIWLQPSLVSVWMNLSVCAILLFRGYATNTR